ncbi:hypothetical protein IACHDJAJ_00174 [Aeromonas phage vB_AdhS_TS3]|nr:hypothetical protein IACHDJAJ_00174 [Aeromonas phage vB_AdhS_TS3]
MLVCQELEQEPDYSKKPLEFSELSEEAQLAVEIYNQMQDTFLAPGMSAPIYTGKDITSLGVLYDIFDVPDAWKITILEMINIIDEEPIRKSRE